MSDLIQKSENAKKPISDKDLETLFQLSSTISFGSITLVFQDGKLVQIEKNEKVRVK